MAKIVEKKKMDVAALQVVAGGTYSNGGSYGKGGGFFGFNGGNNGNATSVGLINIGSGNRS